MDNPIVSHSALENKYSSNNGGANTTSGMRINWFSNSPWSS